ncbi:hypothetical protein ACA910_005676 [Epithemia clementina (nom. ined.)]
MCSGLGEIQAMNAFAVDLIADEEDYERAAQVLTHAITELSSGAVLVEPTPLPMLMMSSSGSYGTIHVPNASSDMDVYFLDTVSTFGAECKAYKPRSHYRSSLQPPQQQQQQQQQQQSDEEEPDCSCFVRCPCMFECILCNQYHSPASTHEDEHAGGLPPPQAISTSNTPTTCDSSQYHQQHSQEQPWDSTSTCSSTCCTATMTCCSSGAWVSSQKHCSVSIACLYNLALCHHLQWNDEKQQQQQQQQRQHYQSPLHNSDHMLRHLVRALDFYQQAFGAAVCHGRSIGGGSASHGTRAWFSWLDPSDPIWPILMAVCTNAAHCAMELAQLPQVQLWNARLCQALHFTQAHADSCCAAVAAHSCRSCGGTTTTSSSSSNTTTTSTKPRNANGAAATTTTRPRHSSSTTDASQPTFSQPPCLDVAEVNMEYEEDEDDEDDASMLTSYYYQRFLTEEYRSFLWHCAFRNKVSGTGAAVA